MSTGETTVPYAWTVAVLAICCMYLGLGQASMCLDLMTHLQLQLTVDSSDYTEQQRGGQSAMRWILAVLAVSTWLPAVRSFSACDDIDIAFVVDTDAISHPGVAGFDLSRLVSRVIQDGSSEDAGLSVVLFGEMPQRQDPVLVTFEDTQIVHSREQEARAVAAATMQAVNGGAPGALKTVTLMEAFALAAGETKPNRDHVKVSH